MLVDPPLLRQRSVPVLKGLLQTGYCRPGYSRPLTSRAWARRLTPSKTSRRTGFLLRRRPRGSLAEGGSLVLPKLVTCNRSQVGCPPLVNLPSCLWRRTNRVVCGRVTAGLPDRTPGTGEREDFATQRGTPLPDHGQSGWRAHEYPSRCRLGLRPRGTRPALPAQRPRPRSLSRRGHLGRRAAPCGQTRSDATRSFPEERPFGTSTSALAVEGTIAKDRLQRISLHAAFGRVPKSPQQAPFLHTYSTVGQPGALRTHGDDFRNGLSRGR